MGGAPQTMDAHTRVLLYEPITTTLLRLAWPNMLVMVAQAAVGLVETYFIGKLGTDALAGVALVFPVVMLMQMMSAGAMGGGIASSIARALGAGRRADADALTLHALVIAFAFGCAFTLGVLGGGPWLYQAMGGRGRSLEVALTYSNWVFTGAVLVWGFNSLAAIIRGTGNMALPAAVTCVGAVLLIQMSPVLIFGWGPFPRLGVAAGAIALLSYYLLGSIALAAYLWSGSRCHGRNQHWSGETRACVKGRLGRRRHRGGSHRGHWPLRGGIPDRVAVAVRHGSGDARRRVALLACRGSVLRFVRPWALAVFRFARRRPIAVASHR